MCLRYTPNSLSLSCPPFFRKMRSKKLKYVILWQMHDDMLFPAECVGEMQDWIDLWKEDQTVVDCVQVHPWLLKTDMVREVGYYDPAFAPQEVEDDDFYYRVRKAG
ncbi:hypothetical protein HKX48_002903 [Thoreauomyces humboldtii]|nr:hypothetical protein HKX48_002903 [Thoreauomyces humboldtii]